MKDHGKRGENLGDKHIYYVPEQAQGSSSVQFVRDTVRAPTNTEQHDE